MNSIGSDKEIGVMALAIVELDPALLGVCRHHLDAQMQIDARGEPQQFPEQVGAMHCVEWASKLIAGVAQVMSLEGTKGDAVDGLKVGHLVGTRGHKVESQAGQDPMAVRGDQNGGSNFPGEARLVENLSRLVNQLPYMTVQWGLEIGFRTANLN